MNEFFLKGSKSKIKNFLCMCVWGGGGRGGGVRRDGGKGAWMDRRTGQSICPFSNLKIV